MSYKRPLPREENFYSEDPHEFIKRLTTAIHQRIVTEFESALNTVSQKPKIKKIDQDKLNKVMLLPPQNQKTIAVSKDLRFRFEHASLVCLKTHSIKKHKIILNF
jgi:hypothetical protein